MKEIFSNWIKVLFFVLNTDHSLLLHIFLGQLSYSFLSLNNSGLMVIHLREYYSEIIFWTVDYNSQSFHSLISSSWFRCFCQHPHFSSLSIFSILALLWFIQLCSFWNHLFPPYILLPIKSSATYLILKKQLLVLS